MKKKRKQAEKLKKTRRKTHEFQASAEGGRLPLDQVPERRGYYKVKKKPVTMLLDADVLAWFQEPGPGYQTRINCALRQVMAEERRS